LIDPSLVTDTTGRGICPNAIYNIQYSYVSHYTVSMLLMYTISVIEADIVSLTCYFYI